LARPGYYEDARGWRPVLYASRNKDKRRDTALRCAQDQGVSVLCCLDGPLAKALPAGLDRTGMQGVAKETYHQPSS
jgi:hypothetical protein